MKFILVVLFLTINVLSSATSYYLSPSGNDATGNGSIENPWFTLTKAWTVVVPGDIIYMRGGTYNYMQGQVLSGKNGTSGNLIKVLNYPGETPVLRKYGSWLGMGFPRAIIHVNNTDYIHLKGLEVCYNVQENAYTWPGIYQTNGNHNIYEQINYHDNGCGFTMVGNCNDNLILNCDFHNNSDPLSSYGNADGITLQTETGNTNSIKGCRSYDNTDDGYDFYYNDGMLLIERCWAFWNGFMPGDGHTVRSGNGTGFKYGATKETHGSEILITTQFCVSYYNCTWGFHQNGANASFAFYNNIAYQNGHQGVEDEGFYFYEYNRANIFTNNISYGNSAIATISSNSILTTNTFLNNGNNPLCPVSDADFVSLDPAGISGTRQNDGSLPEINFLHLVSNSKLVDKGTPVGFPYSGTAPDLGPFETQLIPTVQVPVYTGAVIQNSSPSVVEISYNLSLANILPAAASFTVLVNSLLRAVNSVTVSGTKVYLTLATPVIYGDVVTVSYSKPSSNPLQTPEGGQAVSFSAQSVTNNVAAVAPPPVPNAPPVAVVNYQPSAYSGFESTLNATGSYDTNNDQLTYTWVVPANISASSSNNSVIQFLSPIVDGVQKVEFTLNISDGKTTQTKVIPVEILPYQPELKAAEIVKVEASGYQSPYYPHNLIDGDIGTYWSVNGIDQWVILEFKEPFNIQHVKLAFQPGLGREYYFDIYGSEDKETWDPVLIKSKSCSYSGNLQVFEFPASKTGKEFRYAKLVAQGNSVDFWNYVSEFRIFGYPRGVPSDYDKQIVKIYPNPAYESTTISIKDQSFTPDFINIVTISGKIVYQDNIEPDLREFRIPLNLKRGIYVVQMGKGVITMFTQKLIVMN